jgi:glucose/arabinose dehydrogenase
MNLKPVSLAAAVALMTAAGCARNETPQPQSPETPSPQEMPTPPASPGTPDPNAKPTPPSTTPVPQPPASQSNQ